MTRADIERDPVAYIQHVDAVLVHHSDALEELNTKADQHAITLADHGRVLAEHSAKLNALKRTQDAIAATQSEHSQALSDLKSTLAQQGDLLLEILTHVRAPGDGGDQAGD